MGADSLRGPGRRAPSTRDEMGGMWTARSKLTDPSYVSAFGRRDLAHHRAQRHRHLRAHLVTPGSRF